MRLLIVIAVVAAERIALADAEPEAEVTRWDSVVVGGGGEVIGRDASSAVTGEATIGYRHLNHDEREGFEVAARGTSQLRAGTITDAAAAFDAYLDVGYDAGPQTQVRVPEGARGGERTPALVPYLGIWTAASFGNQPALSARRDVARETYAHTGAGFRWTPSFERRATGVSGWLRFGFGGGFYWQAERRATATFEFGLYVRCRSRVDAQGLCVHVFEVDAVGVSGGDEAVVGNISYVRVSGIGAGGIHAHAGIGAVTNQISIGIDENNGKPPERVETADLPITNELAYDVGVTARAGDAHVALRARRVGYGTLDGDMSIEDRAELAGSLPVAHTRLPEARAQLSLGGFAARTRWWTAIDDPGRVAVTGGGEIALAWRIRSFDVRASAGLARSFYPILDGAAADLPALGFRSKLSISRALDL